MNQNQGKKKIMVYDTTLRDGAQGEGVHFSTQDKLSYVKRIEEMGSLYVEAGWPGANPRDEEFFQQYRESKTSLTRVAAFGSTCKVSESPEQSDILLKLVGSKAKTITIFGKSWDLHVRDVLRATLEENLRLIRESVAYLIAQGREAFFDAEHFFDGFKENPSYALKCISAALEGGAKTIILCDTNGGSLPSDIEKGVRTVLQEFAPQELGIHVHNDRGLAVANSLMAVEAGATQVQGTWNGFGERCGNANLSTLVPLLQLKGDYDVVSEAALLKITAFSRFVAELSNAPFDEKQPFVGRSAFAHKAGMHVDAILKNQRTFEHIDPADVGNERRILISDQAGKANILERLCRFEPTLRKDDPRVEQAMHEIKELEHQGFQFEAAEGSLDLLLLRILGKLNSSAFEVLDYHVWSDPLRGELDSVAVVKVKVGEETVQIASEGNGPVNALDTALRQALAKFFPVLKESELVNYKVRVLDGAHGTEAVVRVIMDTRLGEEVWGTIGVSKNILKASAQALLDAINCTIWRGDSNPG
ncbi:2-isopropylmalate synthase/homocitrate synthase family protein [Desulfosporosinus orientis DSM 765]|uniref:Citramalate synthase n=1 Tax=Desulfosporosinus orientis (strain ATCC 19365 / DSM 765 / NCIMB 8382 / VKM B-1628 / Singapore I) TaxID=768706 RepID=G7W9P1_DESOD|nr:citramalate synthase [Desulfosporosinus orientis]AET70607.1 2-isopropylmalate synthase/homocitrate synthase family protein [Desulfosporosinus orientis DSM 765]